LELKHEERNTYRKSTLDNGLRIVTEEIPFIQSVSIGMWVRVGSRFETPALNGISHFIEHMVFKGTNRRSPYDVAREIDSIGGILDAFTSKEFTAYYCKIMSEHMHIAVDLLSDLFMNPSFLDNEIEREKQVVCQEIYQVEDSPEDLVHEILGTMLWENNPLGQPIFGTIPNVSRLDRPTLAQFKKQTYNTSETVICAAGDIQHDAFVDLIDHYMADLSNGSSQSTPTTPHIQSKYRVVPKELEQVHICLGLEGPGMTDDKRHAAYVINAILGGGMSSRLFQEVREKNGLAYSIGSYISTFSDTGVLGIYAGCDVERVTELMRIASKEIRELPKSITEDELNTAKNQIKGGTILSLESSDARMNRLAKCEYYFGHYVPIEEALSAVEALTLDDVAETAEQILSSGRLGGVILGPVDETNNMFAPFIT
jgi:predicted Zn-dependent peptidase